VTGYRVRALRISATGTVLATTTSAVQPGLARQLTMTLQAGNYRFTVQAINKAGPAVGQVQPGRGAVAAARHHRIGHLPPPGSWPRWCRPPGRRPRRGVPPAGAAGLLNP
jgi:hypothetical protein